MYQVTHFINGQRENSFGRTLNVYNPALGNVCGNVMLADEEIINKAVMAASHAFPSWSRTSPLKRAQIITKFKNLLEKNIEELAQIITQEHGKTLGDARGSIRRGIDVVDFACSIPNLLRGHFSEEVSTQLDVYSMRQPLGVCVGITPFNFPAMISLWMFPIAIGCGNTFILKPSEKDPSVSLRIVELATEAGVPKGVLNVVQGDKEAVDLLIAHPEVKAISSVGSTKVAEYIYQKSTSYGKRVQAFGGAKNHSIIMPDADLDNTIDAIVGAAFGSAGERCMAISVVITVTDELSEKFIQKIVPKIQSLKIGPGDLPATEIGPLINKLHHDKVKSYIEIGIEEGAELLVDGRNYISEDYPHGFYMGGTLFDKVTSSMRIYKEEIFGPVLSIIRVKNFDEALQLVNQHAYGNGTAIFTNDGYLARTFAHHVNVGMVGINVPIPVPVAFYSFGGWKNSMFGDLNMYGTEGIQFYTKLKTVTQHWFKGKKNAEFIMPTH